MAKSKILFIVLDQFRADCLFGELAGSLELPNHRRLMAEGVSFASHYTVTVPCGPARASLLTGRYAFNHRSVRNGTPLDAHLPNLALESRKIGYEPLLFGYTDTSADPRERHPDDPQLKSYEGLLPGFTEMVQMRYESNLTWLASLRAKGYRLPENYWQVYEAQAIEGKPAAIAGPALYRAEDSETAFLTDETLKELAVRRDMGWFAHVTYIRPHPPFVAPAPYNAMYRPENVPPPDRTLSLEDFRAGHPFADTWFFGTTAANLYIGFDGRPDRLKDADADAIRAVYLGLATEVDDHIGRLLNFLDETGQADDTLVIVTADHGEMLGDKRMWGKMSVYEPAYHVPLIIRDPRRRDHAGTIVSRFTESIDLAPTILDWLGSEPPNAFDGRSLLPLMEATVPPGWRDYVFAEIDLGDPAAPTRFQKQLNLPLTRANAAILREERFKLVHFNGGLPPMLFDLEADPDENANIAEIPEFQIELRRLLAKMLDHRMTHADQELALSQLTDEGVVTVKRFT